MIRLVCLASDRRVWIHELSDSLVNMLSAVVPEDHFRMMMAHAVFERGLREWLEARAKARVPNAADWARGTTS